jgi:hypothetical protein
VIDGPNIRSELQEWSAWSKVRAGGNLGYPSRAAFTRLRGDPGSRTPWITDERAEEIDRALCRLKVMKPGQAQIIELYYLDGKTLTKIGRMPWGQSGPMGRSAAGRLLQLAENALEVLLDQSSFFDTQPQADIP